MITDIDSPHVENAEEQLAGNPHQFTRLALSRGYDLADAYQTQKLRPIRGRFLVADQGGDLACPLVALALHLGVAERGDPELARDDGFNLALDWACQEFGEDYALALMDGFDGKQIGGVGSAYLVGYDLGVKTAQQIIGGG